MNNPIARRLYLRIWLALVGSVLILSLMLAWAWHQMDRARDLEREAEPPREVLIHDGSGALVASGQGTLRWRRGEGTELDVTLPDARSFSVRIAPRATAVTERNRPRARDGFHWRHWLRPPYGFLWIFALAGIAVMVGVFPVARRLTKRLEVLQQSVQRWGEGHLDERAVVGGADEIADLSRHFNRAAARVQELLDGQARLLGAQKSLLANASHELRSPLARIRMALELSPGAPPDAAAGAEIARNVAELDALVEEILLASRLDAPEAALGVIEDVDLVGLLVEECARVGAQLELPDGTHELVVSGVAKLLRRALRNLLENGLRYGGAGGRPAQVNARLQRTPGWAVVCVDDHGPGVPPELRERIFEPFYRLPGASERAGGVGLGLALVRSIARHHGGSVACAAGADGGARFTLRLPLP